MGGEIKPKHTLADRCTELTRAIDAVIINHYQNRLEGLQEFTELVADEVKAGRITYAEAQEGLEMFIAWVETGDSGYRETDPEDNLAEPLTVVEPWQD